MKEGWEAEKLVDICKIQYGYPFDSKQFCDDSKYPQLIRIRDVSRGYSETYYSGEIPEGYYIDKGDYLIGMDGEFNIAAWNSERALLNQRVCKITASEETFDRFLFYNLRIILKQIEDETPFVTVKHLSAKRLNAITINLPPLSEQQHIVEELDLLSSIIEKKKAQLKELDNLAQSLFYEMFGDPITNEKGWSYKKLNTLIDENVITYHLDGNHGGDYPRSEEFVDEGVPYIGANSLNNGFVNFSMAKYLPKERACKTKKGLAINGDVLFAHNATVGPVAYLITNEPLVILSTSLTAYRCNQDKMNPLFLRAYMQSIWFESQYKASMKQTTRNQIPITQQKKFDFILPPISLQNQFAEKVQAIEHQKELIKQSIKEVETLFNSRMDYYFN